MCACTLSVVYTAGTAGICVQLCTGAGTERTGRFGRFGTTSIPVPEPSVSSVRHEYRHRKFQQFGTTLDKYPCRRYRYIFRTDAGHISKFGTTPLPVPGTWVRSVRRQYLLVPDTTVSLVRHPHRYREYLYRTEHTLALYCENIKFVCFYLEKIFLLMHLHLAQPVQPVSVEIVGKGTIHYYFLRTESMACSF